MSLAHILSYNVKIRQVRKQNNKKNRTNYEGVTKASVLSKLFSYFRK